MSKSNRKPYSGRLGFLERRVSNRALDLWLSRKRAPEESSNGSHPIETWKQEHPDHQRAVEELEDFLDSPELNAALENVERTETSRPTPYRHLKQKWKQAAWATAAVLVLMVAFQASHLTLAFKADYATETGEQFRGTLPDGSTLVLNTDSAIQLAFSDGERKVHLLKGEALFEVVPNADRPFVVEMNRQKLTVVGTRFIARMLDEKEEAIVLEGRVRAKSQSNELDPGRLLKANDHMILNAKQRISVVKVQRPPAWLEGQLVFDATPLPEAIQELDRYLPETLFLLGGHLDQKRITATYHLDKLQEDLDVLAETLEIDAYRLGPVILFR